MNNKKLVNQIKKVVHESLDLSYKYRYPHLIKKSSRLVMDLGADSLDVVELAMELENEFNCVIPDKDWKQWETVEDIIKYFIEIKND